MQKILFSLLINLFDLFVLYRYFNAFMGKKHVSQFHFSIIVISAATLWSLFNQLGNPIINFVASLTVFFLISMQYSVKLIYRIMLVVLYIGMGFVTEPFGLILLKILPVIEKSKPQYNYYVAVIIVELVRFIIVHLVSKMRIKQLGILPAKIVKMLILIPLISTLNCCFIIHIASVTENITSNILCLTIIIGIIISNYVLFAILNKYNEILYQKHEMELYIQEMKYKDIYYFEIQERNEYIQDLKHDMRNRLSGLYDSLGGSNEDLKSQISALYFEYENKEIKIYTGNAILNSIIKIKMALAKKENISTNIEIRVPMELSIDCGDLGVLYGNLLDNAIESCKKIPEIDRYIKIDCKFIQSNLIIIVKNSKKSERNEKLETTKTDKIGHGRGINSVKKVVEKYNGTILLEDKGKEFEVSVILYGIKGK